MGGVLYWWLAGVAGVGLWLLISFFIWRKMRLDYGEEKVLVFSFVWGAAVASTALLAEKYLPGLSWVGGTAAGLILAIVWGVKFKWNVWEWLDILGPAGLAAAGMVSLISARWVEAAVLFAGWGLGVWLGSGYRRIKWYRSGKVGFSGVFCLVWLAGEKVAVATFSGDKIYWGGLTAGQWIGVWLLTACLVTVYLRADRKITEDLKDLCKKLKLTKRKSE
jgi:hypothetical protein